MCLALAVWTEKSGALAEGDFLDGGFAGVAGEVFAVVDVELLFEVAGLTV